MFANLPAILSHRRSITVSLETYPLKPNPLLSYLSGLDYVCDAGYIQRVIKSRVCFFLYDRLHSRFTRERLRLLLQGIKVTQCAARSIIKKHKRVRASAREKR